MSRRRHLRTRIFVALAALAVGAILLSGFATLALARRATTDQALKELRRDAPTVARTVENVQRQLALNRTATPLARDVAYRRLVVAALQIANASLVTVTADGGIVDGFAGLEGVTRTPAGPVGDDTLRLPSGIDAADLDTGALAGGTPQEGRVGRLVFLAFPLPANAAGTPVLVLTQELESSVASRAAPVFLAVAAVTTVLALGVSYLMARRLTRPLQAMQATAGQIAAGDLSARVDFDGRTDDELTDLARAMNAMTEQLEAARGLERAFLLSVSHDLRTPLTSIRGYAEAISDGTVEGADARVRAAGIIASEARRLERLVADLLDLARLDARQFSLAPRPCDAADVVASAAEAFRPATDEIGLDLRVVRSGTVPADVDPERLGQVVANLVENALKYAASTVVVSVGSEAGQVVVRVDDDGPGLDPSDAPRVFERLYTSRTVPGRRVGTGLGLAIVRELAHAMGGTAAVEAPAGAGTRFVVRVPLARDAGAVPDAAWAPYGGGSGADTGPTMAR